MYLLFVDEAGTLPDPKDRFVVFAGIGTGHPRAAGKIMRRVARRIPVKGKRRRERLGEIKFSSASDRMRRNVLVALAERPDIDVMLLIIDKQGRGVPDTPENYALAVAGLLQASCLELSQLHLVVDKHFNRLSKRTAFDRHLRELVGCELGIEHVDSQQDTRVQLADFVAGATLRWYVFGDDTCKVLFEDRIVAEQTVIWREIKKWQEPRRPIYPGGPEK